MACGPEDNIEGHAATAKLTLDVEETRALLEEVPQALHTEINDVLLAALTMAMAPWTGERSLLVQLEGHGREEIVEHLDTSRTVGWFTNEYPVLLTLAEADRPLAHLAAIKQQLRRVPRKGLGFGLLAWHDDELGPRLRALPRPGLVFNYLGQVDRTLEADALLRPAGESAGPNQAASVRRREWFEVTMVVASGRLRIAWRYCQRAHRRETVERLLSAFAAALRRLIADRAGASVVTPADFPLARLDQTTLDTILAGRPGVEDIYPLSPMQDGMLYHALANPGTAAYFCQLYWRFQGPLDTAALQRAWASVTARHPILRTAFSLENPERPLQIVYRAPALPWIEEDWSGLTDHDARLQEFLAADRQAGMALDKPPLMRFALFRAGPDRHYFAWSQHHMLMDGWSLPIVLREVAACYHAFAAGEEPSLDTPRSFRHYIAWLQQQDRADAHGFWRRTLEGFTQPTTWPGNGSPEARTHEQAAISVQLPPRLCLQIEAFARAQHVTLNTVMQGALAVLMSRYSGRTDVVFGAGTSGRPPSLPHVEQIIGIFLNTLPVRVDANPGEALVPWLRRMQDEQIAAQDYAHTPLAEIQRLSQVPHGVPLFETIMVCENYPDASVDITRAGSLEIQGVRSVEQAHYPLSLSVVPRSASVIRIRAEYAPGRYEPDEIRRLMDDYQLVLQGIVRAEPEARLGTLPVFTPRHRRPAATRARGSASAVAQGALHDGFEAAARRSPHAIAVEARHEGGVERLTYGALDAQANQLARHLRALGIGPETRVGISCQRRPPLLIALLATLKAGGACVPINPRDSASHCTAMLARAGASWLLTSGAAAPPAGADGVRVVRVDDGQAEWRTLPATPVDDDRRPVSKGHRSRRRRRRGELAWLSDRRPVSKGHRSRRRRRRGELAWLSDRRPVSKDPDQCAFVIHTTTGAKPREVAITHRNASALIAWMLAELPRRALRGVVASTPVALDWSIPEIFLPLSAGGRILLLDDLMALADTATGAGATFITTAPSLLDGLLQAAPLPASVRIVTLAGEGVHRSLVDRLYAAGVERVYNLYGPTEATTYTTGLRIPPRARTRPSIGRPIAGARIHILDRHLRPVAPGLPGELFVAGAGVTRGYLEAAATAERFVPDPFGAERGQRLYRTGDLVRVRPDGALEYLGRVDQVTLQGQRIDLGAIESAVAAQPGVRDAAVVIRQTAEGPQLVAFFTSDGAAAEATRMRDALASRLPRHMVPAAFVSRVAMPLTSAGTIDRAALAESDAIVAEAAIVNPRDTVELRVLQLWQAILEVETLGVEDDFFERGGHSLLAVQLTSRIQREFGRKVSLAELFQAPTVAGMAMLLRSRVPRSGSTPLVSIQPRGERPPFFCIHPAGGTVLCYQDLARHLGRDHPFIGIQAHGLEADEEPPSSVEAMAASYAAAIDASYPKGPICLGGWSSGGPIAFETARQLSARRPIAFLAVFDSELEIPDSVPDTDETKLLAMLVRYYLGSAVERLPLSREHLQRLDRERQLDHVLEHLVGAGLLPPDIDFRQRRRLWTVFKAVSQAQARYRPSGIVPCAITLFQPRRAEDPGLGRWDTVTRHGVERQIVPGEHATMVLDPHARELAHRLRDALDRALSSLSSLSSSVGAS